MEELANVYDIYTDGAYSNSIDTGGIGFIILKNNKVVCRYNKVYRRTTNQRMEMLACIIALKSIKSKSNITIYTDSMYIVGTLTQNWKRKANLDLWKQLDSEVSRHNVQFVHVKGHADNIYNNEVDRLATQVIIK